jgi:carboxylate-amine ligase
MDFKPSPSLSVGVELELQILNSRDHNLARDAADLIAMVEKNGCPGDVKPEITESMVEINSTIHHGHESLARELIVIRDALTAAAGRLNLCIAGGGSHPFHKWTERRIYPTERFKHLLEVYGYLAKQFTIFGQHVHFGTVEIRVFDTPLTVERAAGIAAYAQTLARYLLTERPHAASLDV